MMKKLFSLMLGFIFLFATVISVQAAETSLNGQITALFGRDLSTIRGSYNLSDHFGLVGEYINNASKVGVFYRGSDAVKITAGVRYDPIQQETMTFGRFDFRLPFGDNLKFDGYCAQNYDGFEWTQYEATFRIEVFDKQYIHAGVKGDLGNGAPLYSYNPNGEPYLFIKGDFYWKAGSFDFILKPYLYIRGVWFDDYTVKYNFNQQMALAINYYTDFNQVTYLLGGIQWKF
jgi:hypothetical protein